MIRSRCRFTPPALAGRPLAAVILAAVSLLAVLASPALAAATADPETGEARSIMERSEARTKARTETSRYTMELRGPDGEVEQTRALEVFYKHFPDREVTLQKFLAPPILEDTGLMIEDTGAVTNDIWFYLPATRRLRRVSGAEKSNWYLGTQFTYEDFEDYNLDAYRFTLREEAPCAATKKCWVIEAEPVAEAERKASGYSRKIYWIEQSSLYPVRVDYVGRNGDDVKRLTTSGLEKAGEYWRPAEMVMEDLTSGRSTRIRTDERKLDEPLDDDHVSKRYLRQD